MIELPDTSTFASLLAERRVFLGMAVAALAGLVRGFSGFGGALIYMPLIAAIYDPRVAAVTLLLVDFLSSTPFTMFELRRCNWREVWPLAIATALAIPLGTWALLMLDPIWLRWGMAILVIGLLALLMSGWRYKGEPRLPITIGIGLFAGFGAGAVQIAGPAVIIYWLSRNMPSQTVRANLMVFFMLCGAVLVLVYASQGLFDAGKLALAVLLGVPYLLGIGAGSRFFHGTSDLLYRRVAYAIIALAAVLSLPLLDPLVR